MPQVDPFPLPESLSNKVNSPALLAWFQQFGTDGYLSAEEIKAMKAGLDYLYENMGGVSEVPDATPSVKGILKLYANLLASNTDGAVTQAAIVSALLGKADLVGGLIPSSQLPSYVDDIIEGYKLGNVFYTDSSYTTEVIPATGKIYVDLTTGQSSKQYRYTGSAYIQVTNGFIASSNDITEGNLNLFFTAARALAAIPDANSGTKGLLKLYTDLLSSNVDGAVTQEAIVFALASKQNNPLYLSQVDDFALLNTTAQQRIFSGGVDNDGAIPIVAGTRYLIRADINFIELSASVSKSLNIGFLGTSAASEVSIFIWGIITNETGLATVQMGRMANYGGVLSASSSLASFGRIHMSGILECSTSGKLIPTAQFNVSGVGGKTKKGSTFLAIPLGPISSSHN